MNRRFKILLYFTLASIVLIGCNKPVSEKNREITVIDEEFTSPHVISREFTEKRLAVFGDSISIVWPSRFKEISNTQVDNFAYPGASYNFPRYSPEAPSIEEQIAAADLSKYEMIIVAAGTNDWILGQMEKRDPEETKSSFKETISRVFSGIKRDFHGRTVIVIPIHYVNKDNKKKSDRHFVPMNYFREVIYGEAEKYGFNIINASLFEEFSANYNAELAEKYMNESGEDSLHPSIPTGTDRLAERIYGVLKDKK